MNDVPVSKSEFDAAYAENMPQTLGVVNSDISTKLTEGNIENRMRVGDGVGFYIVNTKKDDLRVHYSPDAKSETVTGFLPKGTKVYASDCQGDWAFVCAGQESDWVAKSFLSPVS